jgi:hypothetical protein
MILKGSGVLQLPLPNVTLRMMTVRAADVVTLPAASRAIARSE